VTARFLDVRRAVAEWSNDRVPRLSAALAYYTMLSIGPLLIFSLKLTGALLGEEAARGQIESYVRSNVGAQGAKAIEEMIAHAGENGAGVLAAIIGGVVLLFSASGVFGELQGSLDTIWKVEPKSSGGWFALVKDRFWSMTLVLGVGFLLLVSLVISTVLAGATAFIHADTLAVLGELLNIVVSIGVITVLFALMFKILPHAPVAWSDVWIPAAATAVLFTIGKTLLGWYLARGATTSVYGAAGSLVALLIWVYYAAQIFFFGAELSKVRAQRRGAIAPSKPVPRTVERPALRVAHKSRPS